MASSATTNSQAAAAAATNPKLLLNTLTSFFNNYPGAVTTEVFRLFPDGLLLGSGIFALVTQNLAYTMFFIVVLESMAMNIGLNKLFSFIDLGRTKMTSKSIDQACRSGFQSPTAEGLANMFELGGLSGFPSTHLFVAASAVSYIIFSMQEVVKELSALGPEYSQRYYTGIALSILLLLLIFWNRFSNSCEGFGVLLVSLVLGIFIGWLLMQQNLTLVGREGVNILNIPLFKYKDIQGNPIYICPTSN